MYDRESVDCARFFCKLIDQVRPLKEKERATLILENSNMFCRATTPRCSLQAKLNPGECRKPEWERYSLYVPDDVLHDAVVPSHWWCPLFAGERRGRRRTSILPGYWQPFNRPSGKLSYGTSAQPWPDMLLQWLGLEH
jgi:hypothetical protein